MFTQRYGANYELAAIELGKSERTLRRHVAEYKCDETMRISLEHLTNSYIHPKWESCYWRPDGHIETPYGITRYSDILLVHRYKWHSQTATERLRRIESAQSETDEYLEELQEHMLLVLGKLATRKLG